jgi:hypothetical protein
MKLDNLSLFIFYLCENGKVENGQFLFLDPLHRQSTKLQFIVKMENTWINRVGINFPFTSHDSFIVLQSFLFVNEYLILWWISVIYLSKNRIRVRWGWEITITLWKHFTFANEDYQMSFFKFVRQIWKWGKIYDPWWWRFSLDIAGR